MAPKTDSRLTRDLMLDAVPYPSDNITKEGRYQEHQKDEERPSCFVSRQRRRIISAPLLSPVNK
jgi:hypothetical protein